MPLVLSRRKMESIRIGDDVLVTVLRIYKGQVKLSISAPEHIPILRTELEEPEEEIAETSNPERNER